MVQVIIGGLGSLGRALQKQLLAKGKQVKVLDLAPSAQAAADRLAHPTSVDYVSCDLSPTSAETLQASLKGAETVYNLATAHPLKGSVAEMQRTNVDGVQRLLDACSEAGVAKLVHASSMGMTNQLVDHIEETEEAPLPELDTYKCAYDRTKRLGENLVLQKAGSQLRTCSLRLGTLLAGPGDYITGGFLGTPGKIIMPMESAPMDFVSANDVATAFVSASNKMDAVNGKAINVTKCKNNRATSTTEVLSLFAEQLGWKPILVQRFALQGLKGGYRLRQSAKNMFSTPTDEDTLAFPLDLVIESFDHELTFDNSLARELLDYKPQETWEDAVLRVSKELRDENPYFSGRQVHWE